MSDDPSSAPSNNDETTASTEQSTTESSTQSSTSLDESAVESHLELNRESLDWWMAQDKKSAGDALLKKAMMMMGVSEQLGAESERGKALQAEATELMSFAQDVQNMPESKKAMEEAHKVLEQLNTKYESVNSSTKGIQEETFKLWQSVSSSSEANQLMTHGQNLFNDWAAFAKTDQGRQYLNTAQSKIAGQSGDLVSMVDSHALDADGKPVVQKERLMAGVNQVTDVGRELHKELAEDEDVAKLIAQAQKDFQNATLVAQTAAHSSALDDPTQADMLKDMTEEQKNAMTLMKGEQYIRDLRNSAVAQKLISQGTAYLSSGALSPTQLLGQGQTLYSDEKSRQAFIDKVKDSALEFLMAYLPTAKVPPVAGEKDNVEYTLTGIDLSGFKVLSQDVEVAVNEDDGLAIWARNISCSMKQLQFTYNKKSFPKVSGEGLAEALASGVKFHMRLDLELPERYRKLVGSPSSSKSPSKIGTPAESPRSGLPPPSPMSNKPSTPSLPSPSAQQQPQAQQAPQQPRPVQPQQQQPRPVAPAGKAAGAKPQLTAAQIQQLQFLQQQQATQKRTVVNSALSKQVTAGAVPAQQRPPPVTTQPLVPKPAQQAVNMPRSASASSIAPTDSPQQFTPRGTPISKENIIRNQKAVAKAVAADQPRLVLHSCKVTLDHFGLKILSGDYKFIMNFLLKLFNETVREYIEIQLNNEIQEQSSKLLATVNELSVDYLPLLEKIMVKADKVIERKTGKSVISAVTKDGGKVELIEEGDESAATKPSESSKQ